MNKPLWYLHSTRPKQWVKNLLVYSAPVLHSGGNALLNFELLVTFFAMIMLSGSVYILNDIRDYKIDQSDLVKVEKRPVLSGKVGITEAKIVGLVLLTFSAVLFQLLGTALIALTYLIINIIYNFGGKKIPILEILMVCSGYPLRSWLGAEAGNAPMTWSLTLSLTFGAIAVICAKRLSGNHPANKYYAAKVLESINQLSLLMVALISFVWALLNLSLLSILTPIGTILAVYRVRELTKSRKLAHTENILKDKVLVLAALIAVFGVALHLRVMA